VPRLCILGCGAITERLYLPSLARHPDVIRKLVLVDPDRARAERLAREYGVPGVAASHTDALADAEAVVVAAPHALHHELSVAAMSAGCHVLCEKPLASSPDEARSLVRTAEREGVLLAVNNTRRFYPAAALVWQLLREGRIGEVKRIVVEEGDEFGWPTASGFYFQAGHGARGVLLDLGAHVVDLLCWWMDERPRVLSFRDDSRGGPEAVAHLKLAFAQGATAEVRLSYLSTLANRYRIEGARGVLEGDSTDWQRLTLRSPDGRAEVMRGSPPLRTIEEIGFRVVDDFLGALGGTSRATVQGADVLPSLEVIDDAYGLRERFEEPWMAFDDIRREARVSA
jgi:predicted dehydrogenase